MNINTIESVWLVLEAVDMRLGIDGLCSTSWQIAL
jgi:hypothetical protein